MQNFGIKFSKELNTGRNPVWFMSEGNKLAGNVFAPSTYKKGEKLPTIVVVTPAGAVKEQTAGQHAQALADKGFLTLAFDHRTFGESEGTPRYKEDPFMKVEDIKNAVTFMSCLDATNEDKISILGICSGASYACYATTFDIRVKSVATISGVFDFPGWISVASEIPFDKMLEKSAEARKHFYLTGEESFVDAWYGEQPFAATKKDWEDRNQFGNQASHYYREGGDRGHYEVTNGDFRDSQCIDNRYMMNVNPVLKYLNDRQILAIRGSIALTGPMSDEAISFANEGSSELFSIEGASHIDLYHIDKYVSQSIEKLTDFYSKM